MLNQHRKVDLIISSLAAFLVLIGLSTKVISILNGHWLSGSGAALFYLLMFVLFIFRRPSHESLENPAHYFFALAGTLLPLALQLTPSNPGLWTQISLPIEAIGISISLFAIATLGRGFGIIAANRQIQTRGLYRFIRHPLYTGEALWLAALVLQNLSILNGLLFVVQSACQIKRIWDEEALLQRDPDYATYMTQVRYRIIPGIF
jgi:protein-S-isoprenylcysteine O-methyltransferase Ste14